MLGGMNTAGQRPDATAIIENHDDQSGIVLSGAVIALSRVTLSYLHILPVSYTHLTLPTKRIV